MSEDLTGLTVPSTTLEKAPRYIYEPPPPFTPIVYPPYTPSTTTTSTSYSGWAGSYIQKEDGSFVFLPSF